MNYKIEGSAKNINLALRILVNRIENNPHLEFTYDDLGHTILTTLLNNDINLEELVSGMNSALLDHDIDKRIRIYDKYSDE